jgi:hypothetical protein
MEGRQNNSTMLSIHSQTTPLTQPMRSRRRIPTHRNHIPHRPIIPPQPPRIWTIPPLIRHLSLNTHLLRDHNPAIRLLLLVMAAAAAANRQNMLVAGPHGIVTDRKRVVMRARFSARVLLVFDTDVGLQRVALRARVGVSAEEGAETDEFGELAEEGVDDGEIGDYNGDEGLAAGPETTADCTFWTGLWERSVSWGLC